LLAEHFERGREPLRAAVFYRRAAADAFEGNDFAAAIARAERAIVCGADGVERGSLRLLQAEAHSWRGENVDSLERAEEALALLPHASGPWLAAAAAVSEPAGRLGRADRVAEIGRAVVALVPGDAIGTQ